MQIRRSLVTQVLVENLALLWLVPLFLMMRAMASTILNLQIMVVAEDLVVPYARPPQ